MNEIKPISTIDTSEQEIIQEIDCISERLGKELPMPHANLTLSIIIPAKNEADSIASTLESLAKQINADGSSFDFSAFEILLLCHNCSDHTQEKGEAFFRNNPEIQGHVLTLNSEVAKTVGSARRILMHIAHQRIPKDNGFIVTTDADTIADSYWLYHLNRYVSKNVDLICGLIISDPTQLEEQAKSFLQAKDDYLSLKSRLESQHFPNPNNPWPRHGFNWGPNLAIKKSVYGAIGGIRPLHFLEDVDLYKRVISQGFIARHCLKCKVTTSTRIDSRCTEGFGAELRVWTDTKGVSYKVEGFEKLMVRYRIYRLLQELFRSKSPEVSSEIMALSCIEEDQLTRMIEQSERSESLIIKMEDYLSQSASWNSIYSNTDVVQVCADLKSYFKGTSIFAPAVFSSSIKQVHTGLR